MRIIGFPFGTGGCALGFALAETFLIHRAHKFTVLEPPDDPAPIFPGTVTLPGNRRFQRLNPFGQRF
jgi:hypothetical protein